MIQTTLEDRRATVAGAPCPAITIEGDPRRTAVRAALRIAGHVEISASQLSALEVIIATDYAPALAMWNEGGSICDQDLADGETSLMQLFAALVFAGEQIAYPTRRVDGPLHAFMNVDTIVFREFCFAVFGGFLDHIMGAPEWLFPHTKGLYAGIFSSVPDGWSPGLPNMWQPHVVCRVVVTRPQPWAG